MKTISDKLANDPRFEEMARKAGCTVEEIKRRVFRNLGVCEKKSK